MGDRLGIHGAVDFFLFTYNFSSPPHTPRIYGYGGWAINTQFETLCPVTRAPAGPPKICFTRFLSCETRRKKRTRVNIRQDSFPFFDICHLVHFRTSVNTNFSQWTHQYIHHYVHHNKECSEIKRSTIAIDHHVDSPTELLPMHLVVNLF